MVFPHAIAQGASWDPALIRRMSNVTAVEARISSAISYQSSGTDQGVDLSCDGELSARSSMGPNIRDVCIVALHYRSSTLYHIHERVQYIYF